MSWNTWIRTVEIEPSVWAAEPARLETQVEALLRTGARLFHVDVGAGRFDPPVPVVERLAPLVHRYQGVIDVHYEGADAVRDASDLAFAGADNLTFAFADVDAPSAIAAAHEHGLQAGISFGPESVPEDVAAVSGDADVVLCISAPVGPDDVDPGLLDRVRRLRRTLPAGVKIQVEGGIAHENAGELYRTGASVLVIGSAIFEREDLPRTYRRLVQALA